MLVLYSFSTTVYWVCCMRLDGRRVLVVGVGSGLGPATVYFLLKDGAKVVMAARTAERLEDLKSKLKAYGNVDFVSGDASRMDGAEKIVNEAVKKLGGIDDLVVLAGNYMDTPIESIDESGVNAMVDANLKAPLYTIRNALPHLNDGGSIVMVSAVFGTYASSIGNVAYSATKAGVAKATEVLANELIKRKIRVNAVAPRAMRHDFVADRDWKRERNLGDPDCPPEDVASVIVWLLTGESSWINGTVIPIDGGKKK